MTEPMLMILPPPWSRMTGATAPAQIKLPVRFTFSTRCQSSMGSSCDGLIAWVPAALTRMSIRPCRERTSSTAAATSCGSATSATTVSVPGPSSAAARDSASRCRPRSTTVAPASAKALPTSDPRPPLPPVTSAPRPAKSNSCASRLLTADPPVPLHPSAAVDVQRSAGDEPRLFRDEELYRRRHFLRSPHPAQGNACDYLGPPLRAPLGGHVGFNGVGRHAVDGNAVARELPGQRLGQVDDAGLRGTVARRGCDVPHPARNGGDVDNASPPLLHHDGRRVLGAVENAFEVDG